jgi:hypothetical protein
MAADSKGVYTNAQTNERTNSIVSKIYRQGQVYFSLAGLTSNKARGFDVARIVDSKLRNTNDVDEAIQQVKAAVKNALLVYLENQKRTTPALFQNNLDGDRYITSIGFITIRKNRPYTHLIGFMVSDGDKVRVKTEEEEYAGNNKRDAVYYLGTSGEINRYMNTIRSNNIEPVRFVEKLMNLQAAKTPALVSAPIDIIKITPAETVWIKRKKGTPVELD